MGEGKERSLGRELPGSEGKFARSAISTPESDALAVGVTKGRAAGGEDFRTISVRGRYQFSKLLISGGRYWDRTSGPCRVKAVLYR